MAAHLFANMAEVFHEDFLPNSLPYTPAHIQVLLGKVEPRRTDESITFLYKLRYGLELTSHAEQCELLCGIPHSIVDRAAYVAQLSRDHNLQELQLRIQDELHHNQADQDLQRAENIARAFVHWDLRADEEAAENYGENQSFDPCVKLRDLLAGAID